ncbi:hypothetical protein QTN25_008478 [Entamoeba marina]
MSTPEHQIPPPQIKCTDPPDSSSVDYEKIRQIVHQEMSAFCQSLKKCLNSNEQPSQTPTQQPIQELDAIPIQQPNQELNVTPTQQFIQELDAISTQQSIQEINSTLTQQPNFPIPLHVPKSIRGLNCSIPLTYTFPNQSTNTFPNTFANQSPNALTHQRPYTFPNTSANQSPNTFANQFPNTFANQSPNTFANQFPNALTHQCPYTIPNQSPNTFPNTSANQSPNTFANQFPNALTNQCPYTFPNQSPNTFPTQTPVQDTTETSTENHGHRKYIPTEDKTNIRIKSILTSFNLPNVKKKLLTHPNIIEKYEMLIQDPVLTNCKNLYEQIKYIRFVVKNAYDIEGRTCLSADIGRFLNKKTSSLT